MEETAMAKVDGAELSWQRSERWVVSAALSRAPDEFSPFESTKPSEPVQAAMEARARVACTAAAWGTAYARSWIC